MRGSYGTTKYCMTFLRGASCSDHSCMNLHEWGDESDCFTKEDLTTLYVTVLLHRGIFLILLTMYRKHTMKDTENRVRTITIVKKGEDAEGMSLNGMCSNRFLTELHIKVFLAPHLGRTNLQLRLRAQRCKTIPMQCRVLPHGNNDVLESVLGNKVPVPSLQAVAPCPLQPRKIGKRRQQKPPHLLLPPVLRPRIYLRRLRRRVNRRKRKLLPLQYPPYVRLLQSWRKPRANHYPTYPVRAHRQSHCLCLLSQLLFYPPRRQGFQPSPLACPLLQGCHLRRRPHYRPTRPHKYLCRSVKVNIRCLHRLGHLSQILKLAAKPPKSRVGRAPSPSWIA